MFIYCIVATIVEWNRYRDEEGRCRFTKEGVFVAHGIVVPYIFMTFAMALLTMRIRKEFREIRIYIGLSFLMVVASSLIFLLWSLQLIRLRGVRIVMMICPFVLGIYFLISTLGECMLRFFLCQHRWFDKWIDKFHANTQRQLRNSLLSHRPSNFNDVDNGKEQMNYVQQSSHSQKSNDTDITTELANVKGESIPTLQVSEHHFVVEQRRADIESGNDEGQVFGLDSDRHTDNRHI